MNTKARIILVLLFTLAVAVLYGLGIVPALAASVFILVLLVGTGLLLLADYMLRHPLKPH